MVYRATDRRDGAEVAVKVLSVPGRSPEALLRFTQERLVRLHHPCLVASLGGFDDGDVACLAMELVAGQTLSDRVATGGALTPAEAVAVALDLLDGLACAHSAGVIHRDGGLL